MQLQLPQEDLRCAVTLNQAMLALTDEGKIPFLLDIDVSDEWQEFSDEESIWLRLDELRCRKNLIFESCITDKTRELFG